MGDGLRILFVDDHADTANAMTRVLRAMGHRVKTAGTAALAIELCDAEPFDLLISDIGLPDRSGLELMRELSGRSSVRGIALTGLGASDDIEKMRAAGFSEHLLKPVDIDGLAAAIARVVPTSDDRSD